MFRVFLPTLSVKFQANAYGKNRMCLLQEVLLL